MSGINKVILIGNLGHSPEIRTIGTNKVASFSLATSESWKDKATGERKELTEWHRVVVFNQNLVEVIEKFVQKGTKLFIQGSLRTRKWQNKQGQDVYTTEVILNGFQSQLVILAGMKDISGDQPPAQASDPEQSPMDNSENINTVGIDDIPF